MSHATASEGSISMMTVSTEELRQTLNSKRPIQF